MMKRDEYGRILKGSCLSRETQFKKGELSGKDHPQWKGGRNIQPTGYVYVYAPDHPKAYGNRYYEHIIVAERKLGRYLVEGETVHHINGIKDDNRPDNLVVCATWNEHRKHHRKHKYFSIKNIPFPRIVGERIVIEGKRRSYAARVCQRCGKLFWSISCKKAKFCSRSRLFLGNKCS